MKNLKWRGDVLFLSNLPVAQFLYCEVNGRYEIYDAVNNILGFNDVDGPKEAKKVFRRLVKKSIKGEINYLQK